SLERRREYSTSLQLFARLLAILLLRSARGKKYEEDCRLDRRALWRKVIVEIHGSSGGFDLLVGPRKSSTWSDIVSSCNRIEQLGVPLNNIMVLKIYRGTQTLFWMDNWLKDLGPLKDCSPGLFALEQHKDCLVADRWVLEEDVWQGKWAWTRKPSK
ncbi:hypothetical protein Tco_0077095, partial [Tanacetum coccineum]